MLPCSVCSFTALLRRRKFPHGNNDRSDFNESGRSLCASLSRTSVPGEFEFDPRPTLRCARTTPRGAIARDTGQFSLAGAQPKTALLFDNKRWGVPSGVMECWLAVE